MVKFNQISNRGLTDILLLTSDGLTGIPEAVAAAYPQATYQGCWEQKWARIAARYQQSVTFYAINERVMFHSAGIFY